MNPQFPQDFYFGAATSSHQVEGGNSNDWTEWEKKNAERLSKIKMPDGNTYPPKNFISGKTTDHYNRYEADFDIAKELGHNAHRFSIEWSRIEPLEGIWNEREIEHYRSIIHALKKRNIEPFVTLWHFTLPHWIANSGGVASKQFPERFKKYAERMALAFGNEATFWITINEPEIYALNSYYRGIWPPERKGIFSSRKAAKNMIRAHRNAYEVIKKNAPQSKVGIAVNLSYFESSGGTINTALKSLAEKFWNHYVLKRTKRALDWIGLNYYFHNRIAHGFNQNKNELVSDLGWELYPQGIKRVLEDLGRYKKPIYITENGLADRADTNRGWFIQETLKAVREAMQDGADVRGYFHWSLLDNFEWDKGFWPRFGLIEIDYKTLKRTPRSSAKLYKEIIEKGLI